MPSTIGKIPIHVLEKGIRCPHCTQFAKIYERTINSAMARSLINLYRAGKPSRDREVSANGSTGDIAKLRYWNFVAIDTKGFWSITEHGQAFVEGRARAHQFARLYDSNLLGLVGDMITIRDALGTKFSYEDLMTRPITRVITRTPVRTPVAS